MSFFVFPAELILTGVITVGRHISGFLTRVITVGRHITASILIRGRISLSPHLFLFHLKPPVFIFII
jgi:hypothetical protein